MTALKMSIVIPVLNEEQTIIRCVQHLQAQLHPIHEILIIDNNSTDSTVNQVRSLPNVRVIYEKVQGRCFARNTGFDAATGDIIVRIDADARPSPDWLVHIAKQFDAQDSNKAWSGGADFYNIPLRRLITPVYNSLVFESNWILTGGGMPTWGSNMALTKDVWNRVRAHTCMRNDIHEDLDLGLHLHAAGVRVKRDYTMRMPAEMRRVIENRSELWEYLQLWPRTLRVHGHSTWIIAWIIGALGLYIASSLPYFINKFRKLDTNDWLII